jgi:predicted nuclease of predicted toxin-antitoxin system
MPAILLDALLDEDAGEMKLYQMLADQGHNVERVVDVSELGEGADDDEVEKYAERHDHVIITHDEGLYQRYKGKPGPVRLLWIIDQQDLEASEKAQMIENVVENLNDFQSPSDQPAAIPVSQEFLY